MAIQVVAWLVTQHHAGLQTRLIKDRARADTHGRLMHIEIVAHAVARAVAVLEVIAPAWSARQRINDVSGDVHGEDELVDGYVALQHARKAAALLGRRRAKVERARHVRRAKGKVCLLYTSPSPRDKRQSRMPSSA